MQSHETKQQKALEFQSASLAAKHAECRTTTTTNNITKESLLHSRTTQNSHALVMVITSTLSEKHDVAQAQQHALTMTTTKAITSVQRKKKVEEGASNPSNKSAVPL